MPKKKSDHGISRRDFLNGTVLSLAAGTSLSPIELLARNAAPTPMVSVYPPALDGMRGSHAGSFEVAHAVALEGRRFPLPREQSDAPYDLIVAGGGVSGLAAALLYRQRAGGNPRILILDNHDDFGGHAKRNEFTVGGKRLIGYGGSQSIDSPASWSRASARVLKDIAIETDPFYQYFDRDFSTSRNLGEGLFFSAGHYGKDQLRRSVFGSFGSGPVTTGVDALIDSYPLSAGARTAMIAGASAVDYATLTERASQIANLLVEIDVRPGDRVAVLLENGADAAGAFFGPESAASA